MEGKERGQETRGVKSPAYAPSSVRPGGLRRTSKASAGKHESRKPEIPKSVVARFIGPKSERFFWKLYGWCSDSIYHLMPYRKLLWDTYQALDLKPGMKILDAGCGTGNFEKFTSEKDPPPIKIEAIDFSPVMLARAMNKCKDLDYVNFKLIDLNQKLPYSNHVFDHIVCLNALHRLQNPHFTFQELNRLLKPGGKLIMAESKPNAKTTPIVREQFRRIKNIWGLSRKSITFLGTIPRLPALRLASALQNRFNSENREENRKRHFRRKEDFITLLDQNKLQNININPTHAEQSWFVHATKPLLLKDKSIIKQKVIIRTATIEDVESMLRVEEEAWPEGMRASRKMLISRIQIFPEGQFLGIVEGQVEGVCCTEILHYDLEGPIPTWQAATDSGVIEKSHNTSGQYLFGINLSVTAKGYRYRVADRLIDDCKELVRSRKLKAGLLGGRLPGYHKYSQKFSPYEYIMQKTNGGRCLDPELEFWRKNEVHPVKVLPNYFPDPESLDYGVLLMWENRN